jgi:hypothetical protein
MSLLVDIPKQGRTNDANTGTDLLKLEQFTKCPMGQIVKLQIK